MLSAIEITIQLKNEIKGMDLRNTILILHNHWLITNSFQHVLSENGLLDKIHRMKCFYYCIVT